MVVWFNRLRKKCHLVSDYQYIDLSHLSTPAEKEMSESTRKFQLRFHIDDAAEYRAGQVRTGEVLTNKAKLLHPSQYGNPVVVFPSEGLRLCVIFPNDFAPSRHPEKFQAGQPS